jgi:tetraacyldisaccharide 4'-kinase
MISFGPIIEPLTRARNFLFEKNILSSLELPCKVVSIGNITMGGTGKTPMTSYLYQYYKKNKIGIIVRSYKTDLDHPEIVPAQGSAASQLGDEALLLKWKCPEAVVVSGPNKTESAAFLLSKYPEVEVILIDDGFQHRKLKRHLDIVLLDASVQAKEYSWPLKGRLRESLDELHRAQVVILTKMDQQDPETVALLTSRLPQEILLLESFQKVSEPYQVSGVSVGDRKRENLNKVFAFCGIAKPENFKQSLEKKIEVSEFLPFSDHHFYSDSEIKEILLKKAQQYGVTVTTEKDFMRLQAWPKNGPPLFVLPLDVELHGPIERFYELLKI